MHQSWAERSVACFREFGIAKIRCFPAHSVKKPNLTTGYRLNTVLSAHFEVRRWLHSNKEKVFQ